MVGVARRDRPGQDFADGRQRPIDLAHLARQTLGDEGLEREVLRIFEQRIRADGERLRSVEAPEEALVLLRHIAAAAGGVGARALDTMARAAIADQESGAPTSPEALADVGLALEEVRTFISEMLDGELA